MSDGQSAIRVQQVQVTGLFGLYSHEVVLRMDERVTILHGPNGVGKTALLRLIAGAFSGRYTDFAKYRFDSLRIHFSDTSVLTYKPKDEHGKDESNKLEQTERCLHVSYAVPGQAELRDQIALESSALHEWVARFAAEMPFVVRIGPDKWADRQYNDEVTSLEVYHRYGELRSSPRRKRFPHAESKWLTELRARVNVHLIETQRLLRMSAADTPRYRGPDTLLLPTVRDYARDLSDRIRDTLARYGTESQALDQSFPQRLLRASDSLGLSTADLKLRMSELDKQRADLQAIGLLDRTSTSPFDVASLDELAPHQNAVMSLYVEDTQKKLAVLDALATRITLLLENVNQKFKHKSIKIERDKGFIALGHDGAQLDSDSLSSGEQHELVLLYDLLFRVRRGTLVLIDEPELSLHVGWQKRFLPDLLQIVHTAELDAIIATHSPFIVGDRSDLLVPLGMELDS